MDTTLSNKTNRMILFTFLLFALACANENSNPKPTNTKPTVSFSSTDSQSNRFTTGSEYLTIKDVSRSSKSNLSFNISWDASWKQGDEYDAAWVFVKAKQQNGQWRHARIVKESAMTIANSLANGAEAIIEVSPDNMGMIIRRKLDGNGDNDWNVSIEIENEESEESLEFRVFALEMVHVTSGSYELGTLKGERDRSEVLTPGAGGAPYDPFFTFKRDEVDYYGGIYQVKSEAPITIGKEDGNLYWIDANIPGTNTFSGRPEGELAESFPKGYGGFYQMKYELSQQEYCDFLNTLTLKQKEARDISKTIEFNRPIADYRNMIYSEDGIFYTTRPHRPCNFISWLDGQAYADWAGLRHMTEMEFEKSCRGPEKAIYREYVWGVNEIKEKDNMQFSTTFYQNDEVAKQETGEETTDGNVHASMFSYRNFIDVCTPQGNFYDPKCDGCRSFTGGDERRGPVRKGIFGTTSEGDRIKAGATYFGAMEMGGNLQEPVVTVGHPSGRKFEGSHGDGNLTNEGNADNSDWMPIDNQYAFGGRGGCWKFHENHARTSDRFKGLRTNPNRRASHIGFRGVRTSW